MNIDAVFNILSIFGVDFNSQSDFTVAIWDVGIENLIANNYESDAGSGLGGLVAGSDGDGAIWEKLK